MSFAFPKPTKQPKQTHATLDELAYMACVKQLPCVICGRHPVDVHHCICDRFSSKRASHFDTIPLCDAHHQGLWVTGECAIHKSKAAWTVAYGPDHGFIPQTRAAVAEMRGSR